MSASTQAPTPVRRYTTVFPTGQHNISDGDGVGPSSGAWLEVFRQSDKRRPSSLVLSCSVSVIPHSDAVLKRSGLPIALSLSPLASPDNLSAVGLKSDPTPLIRTPPIRCQRCHGYMSPYNILLNESWTCVLCSRVNPYPAIGAPSLSFHVGANAFVPTAPQDYSPDSGDPLPYAEFFCATVEYDVSGDLAFLPSTADASGARFSELNPGEVSHVQSSVLSTDSVMQANAIELAIEYPLIGTDPAQNRFEGNNCTIPTSECLYERTLPITNADELIASATSSTAEGTTGGSMQIFRKVQPVCLPFNVIVLIPVTINSINSGVLASTCNTLLHVLPLIDTHVSIVPLFYNARLICYRRRRGDIQALEEIEISSDLLTSEPILPYPVEELALTRDIEAEQQLLQKIVSTFYTRASEAAQAGVDQYSVSAVITFLSGCISTLQRTCGKVVLIQTDPVTRGMGANPLPIINPLEYSTPSVEKAYLSRSIVINKLAYVAATHNIGIDLISLPVDKSVNLGLVPLSALCILTGGNLLYNEASAYASKHGASVTGLGNADFITNALIRLLTCQQGIAATLSIRASEGLSVNMQDTGGELSGQALNAVLSSSGASALWTSTRDFLASAMRKSSASSSNSNNNINSTSQSNQLAFAANNKGQSTTLIENVTQLVQAGTKPRYKQPTDEGFYANYYKVSDIEYSFASVNEHNSYTMELKYDAKLAAETKHSYVQTALLYTCTDGSRRIRVSTLQLSVQDNLSDIYSGVQQGPYISWFAKRLAFSALNNTALVTGHSDAFGGHALLEKPVSDSGLSVEIGDGIVKYGKLVIGSTAANEPPSSQFGGSAPMGLSYSALATDQSTAQQTSQSIKSSIDMLRGKRHAVDDGARTGHMSGNGAVYMMTKYSEVLSKQHSALSTAPATFLFDGEYAYTSILNGKKLLEQMVWPAIKMFRGISAGMAYDRLTIPSSMDTVPVAFLGTTRTAFCHDHRPDNEGGSITADVRCSTAFNVVAGSPSNLASILYPVMYNLTNYLSVFTPEVEAYHTSHPEVTFTMPLSLPCPVRACSRYIESMTRSILYIVSGHLSFLWVGSAIDGDLRTNLFGAVTHNRLRVAPLSTYASLCNSNNLYSAVLQFTRTIKALTGCCGVDIVVPEGAGGIEGLVRWHLIEDSTSQDPNYNDFLNEFAVSTIAST